MKRLLSAMAVVLTAPLAANAVPLFIEDPDLLDDAPVIYSVVADNFDLGWFYSETILNRQSTGSERAVFSFINDTNRPIRITAGLPANANPDPAFSPRATFAWGDDDPVLVEGGTIFSGTIAQSASRLFSVNFGTAVGSTGFGQVDVAFQVAPIPLPAGAVFLATCIGGLGIMRVRKQDRTSAV